MGKTLLSTAIAAIMAITGATLHTVYVDHSTQLSGISQQITDLSSSVRDHNTTTDAAIGKLLEDDQKNTAAIASEHAELEDIRREPPRLVERETVVPAAPRAPDPIPSIGSALQHIFPGLQPHRHYRGRP